MHRVREERETEIERQTHRQTEMSGRNSWC